MAGGTGQRQSGGWWEEGQEFGAGEGRRSASKASWTVKTMEKTSFFPPDRHMLRCLSNTPTPASDIKRKASLWHPYNVLGLSCFSGHPHTKSHCLPLLALHPCSVFTVLLSVSCSDSSLLILLSGWCFYALQPLCLPFPMKFLPQVHLKHYFFILTSLFQTLFPNFFFTLLHTVCGWLHLAPHGPGMQKPGHKTCVFCGKDLPRPVLSGE